MTSPESLIKSTRENLGATQKTLIYKINNIETQIHNKVVQNRQIFSLIKLQEILSSEVSNLVAISHLVNSCNSFTDSEILTPIASYFNSGLSEFKVVSRYFMEHC